MTKELRAEVRACARAFTAEWANERLCETPSSEDLQFEFRQTELPADAFSTFALMIEDLLEDMLCDGSGWIGTHDYDIRPCPYCGPGSASDD